MRNDHSGDRTERQTNSDSSEHMSNYDSIITTGDDQSDNNNDTDNGWNWSLGNHTTSRDEDMDRLSDSITATMDGLDAEIDSDMMDVLEDAQSLVQSTEVTRFECPHEQCGLGHSHSDHKHDIRSSHNASPIAGFNITPQFAEQMEFVPYCHCGANEAAMLVQFFPYISIPMFKDEDEMDGVNELPTDELSEVINTVVIGEKNPRHASLQFTDAEENMMQEHLQRFLERVEQMQNQANSAPISQETRGVIEANREELEVATSE